MYRSYSPAASTVIPLTVRWLLGLLPMKRTFVPPEHRKHPVGAAWPLNVFDEASASISATDPGGITSTCIDPLDCCDRPNAAKDARIGSFLTPGSASAGTVTVHEPLSVCPDSRRDAVAGPG